MHHRTVDPRRWAMSAALGAGVLATASCGGLGLGDGRDYCGTDLDFDPANHEYDDPCEPGDCEPGSVCHIDGFGCTDIPELHECNYTLPVVEEATLGADTLAMWALDADLDGTHELVAETGEGLELRKIGVEPAPLPVPPDAVVIDLVIADLDGDGHPDLGLLLGFDDARQVLPLLGDGELGFVAAAPASLAASAVALSAVELDGQPGAAVVVARDDAQASVWSYEPSGWTFELGLAGLEGVEQIMTWPARSPDEEDLLVLRSATSSMARALSGAVDPVTVEPLGHGAVWERGMAIVQTSTSGEQAVFSSYSAGSRTVVQILEPAVGAELEVSERRWLIAGRRPDMVSIDFGDYGRDSVVVGADEVHPTGVIQPLTHHRCWVGMGEEVLPPFAVGDFDGDGLEELASSGADGTVRLHGLDI